MADRIRFSEPGELIAAIPGLLPFTPSESAVVIMFTGSIRLTVRGVVRMDLAPLVDPATAATTVEQLRAVVTRQGISSVVTVVIGGSSDKCPGPGIVDRTDGALALPHLVFVAELQWMAGSLGVGEHTLWVDRIERGRTWHCYTDPGCTGTVADPRTSLVAVARVAAGEVAYSSRDDLAAQLTDPPADLDRRAALLRQLPPLSAPDAAALVGDSIQQISETGATGLTSSMFDDEKVVRLAHALTHDTVRDTSLAFMITDPAVADPAAAERLWFVLTRATPRPEATHPATLLAIGAALRGDGAFANIALDAALAADPANRLAGLLRAVLAHGIPPEKLRRLVAESVIGSRVDTPQSTSLGAGGELT